jgi:NifU-like protein involved in Fe-S cluster formation
MYTRQVADHIAQPRNVGELDHPSGVGDVTNEVCLDRIKLTIRVEGARLIDAKVQAQGCPPTIAAASVLTEMIIDRPLTEVQLLTRKDIVESLGRLPAAKMHCASLAIDALRAAIDDIGT